MNVKLSLWIMIYPLSPVKHQSDMAPRSSPVKGRQVLYRAADV